MTTYDTFTYLPTVTVRSQLIYVAVLLAVVGAGISLPFLFVDVVVRASGLVRPVTERSEAKATATGTVAALLVRENQSVRAGQALVRLRSDVLETKLRLLAGQQAEKKQYIQDLTTLIQLKRSELLGLADNQVIVARLGSPLYRQQFEQFRFVMQENWQTQQKRRREVQTSQLLLRDKVIARLEHEDKEFAFNSVVAQYNTLMERQRSDWQTALAQHRRELTDLRAQERQGRQEQSFYTVRAPVGGTVSGLAGRYVGSAVQIGEVVGTVSPDSTLVVECYVLPKDIGLLRTGQTARFQIEAFDYNQFGMIMGRILTIDNDFSVVDNGPLSRQPVFRVRCQLDQAFLTLPNGYRGNLKKGMTVQARFVITRRSVFQLLYDKADDWLNPTTNRS